MTRLNPTYETLALTVLTAGLVQVLLNLPEQYNTMLDGLKWTAIEDEDDCRVAILISAGDAPGLRRRPADQEHSGHA